MRAYVLRLVGLAVAWWAKIDRGSEELAEDARDFEWGRVGVRWSPLGTSFARGVAVLLEEMDNDDDENIWLSEVNAEGFEERLPRWVEGTIVCVDALDNEDDEDEHDGAGDPDRGEIEVEVGSGTALKGWRAVIAWVYRELRDVLRYYFFFLKKKKSTKYSTKWDRKSVV